MRIVFFKHPTFFNSLSISLFANMLSDGMRERGHEVEFWMPEPRFYNIPKSKFLKKWFGYIDQYILFPVEVYFRLNKRDRKTLFVLIDNAQGPWVPLVYKHRHVIHCHDFTAQKLALGDMSGYRTGWSGRQYQAFIRGGYRFGKNFISVSEKTQIDLHYFLTSKPALSTVVYNGLNRSFDKKNKNDSRQILNKKLSISLEDGFILHVGGNQWYKNRLGVIDIYDSWRSNSSKIMPLLLVGQDPDNFLKKRYNESKYKSDIHFLSGFTNEYVQIAYSAATVLLFPSLAEGFGWPIVEAMVSGCPVITTNEAPMTEIAGEAGLFIPKRPVDQRLVDNWAKDAAKTLDDLFNLSPKDKSSLIESCLKNADRFETNSLLDKIEKIYANIICE